MPAAPLITIVIVNYKTGDLVCQAVACAKTQAARDGIGIHIAVVDNGSEDGSLERIRAAHPDIELIDAGANLGFAAGNNIALRNVTSPYAMLLNSDAFIQDGMLRKLAGFMEDNPDCGMAGPRVLNPDGTDQDYPCRFPTLAEMMRRALKGPQFPAQGKSATQPIAMERIHGCCLMMRREVLEQVGLMDEQFFIYDEEMDWCLRTAQAGWKLWLLPDATVIHLGGQTSGRAPSGQRDIKTLRPFNPRMSYELRKSRYILYRKHRSKPEIFALKILTDCVLAAGCALALKDMMLDEANRQNAKKKLTAFTSIMRINPFRLEVKA